MRLFSHLAPHLFLPTRLLMYVFGTLVLTSYSAYAMDVTAQKNWAYTPSIGLEGQAYVTDGDAARMEVECGNGGGPAINLSAPSVSHLTKKRSGKLYPLTFVINGKRWTEQYECFVKQSQCGSFGFPSRELVQALRQGDNVFVWFDKTRLAKFSLKSSNAAITPLSSCLGPDVY